jgi:hypothetical protein
MLVDLDVWAGDLYAGSLPPICVFTGQATPGIHSVRYTTAPRWVIALLFAGVIPYLIALMLLRRSVTGTLPMCPRALRRFVVQRIATLVIVVVIPIACFGVGGWLASTSANAAGTAVILAGAALFVCGLVACSIWAGAIGIAGRIDDRPGWGRWVRLRGVNPTFAAAVHRLYRNRAPEWQIGTVPPAFIGVPLPRGYAPAPGPVGWLPPRGPAGPPVARPTD